MSEVLKIGLITQNGTMPPALGAVLSRSVRPLSGGASAFAFVEWIECGADATQIDLSASPAAGLLGLLEKGERRLMAARARPCDDTADQRSAREAMKSALPGAPTLQVQARRSADGKALLFTSVDIERIASRGLDLLLHVGDVVPDGDVLRATRLGLISLQFRAHGENCVRPGKQAPGLDAVRRRNSASPFIIELRDAQGRMTLAQASYRTRLNYLANRQRLESRAGELLRKVLERIGSWGSIRTHAAGLPAAPGRSTGSNASADAASAQAAGAQAAGAQAASAEAAAPALTGGLALAHYAASVGLHIATKLKHRLRHEANHFGVLYAPGRWDQVDWTRARAIENPAHRFLADPFVVSEGGRHYCFLEDYDFRKGRADIRVHELLPDGSRELGVVIDEPFHLSYPYVFEYRGERYMVPEAIGSKQLRLYRCVEFPLKWTLHGVLMDKVSAADTIIFERGDRWWMLTNIDPADEYEHYSELHAFHSDDPTSDRWTPHPANPLIVDAHRGRNAGCVITGEELLRCGQDHDFDLYGTGLSVMRVTRLDMQDYREELVRRFVPDYFPGLIGTHHLHSNGQMSVVDFQYRARPGASRSFTRTST